MTSPEIQNQNSKIQNEEETGLPLLHTWPSLYLLVLSWFAIIVLALFLFTRTFS